MPTGWSFLSNPFISATEGSYRSMKKIGEFTLSALEKQLPPPSIAAPGKTALVATGEDADFYSELRNELKPLMLEYNIRYNAWMSSFADRKSQTSKLTDMFNLLRSEKIRDWDITIQTVYNIRTPQYKRLLPRRRAPFQTGSQRTRLDAVELLVTQITGDTNFDEDFITGIANFYQELNAEYQNQSGEKSDTRLASEELEPSRMALAIGLYGTLGKMIGHFKSKPDKIYAFFDFESIRNSEQSIFRHSVKPNATINAFQRRLVSSDMIRIVNDGDGAELKIWLAASAKEAPGETFVTVEAGKEKTIPATDLGTLTNRYLNVKNLDTKVEGHYIISIM